METGIVGDKITTSVTVMFLIDCALMFQVIDNSDVPIVKLTSKSIV
jgi:DNA polymerase sigma